MNEFKKQLGRKIKEIRLKLRLKQDEFSAKIGIEPPTLSNIETGKTTPTLITIKNIIDAFNIEPNDLFDCKHLLDESSVDKEVKIIYQKLSLDKKQYFLRLIKFLFDTKDPS